MMDMRRVIMVCIAVAIVGGPCVVVGQTVEKSVAGEAAVESTPEATLVAAQPSAVAQFKQINIINVDEGVFEKGRLSQLKGHIEMVLVPREPEGVPQGPEGVPLEPKGVPVRLKADKATCTYATDLDTMPDKVVAEGHVDMVQGENRFQTDVAVWYSAEGKVVCEGNVEITYGESTMFAERLEHFLADERTVVTKGKGTIIPPEPVEEPVVETPEGTPEPVQDTKP
jgi:hypothetical protein